MSRLELSLRRLEFSVEAIGEVAAKASNAKECSELSLLAEGKHFAFSLAELRSSVGGFNRLFSLALDNGKEVVVRMPFKNAGPRTLLTQSEVATMDFLRTKLGFPIPKVLAWNASPNNPVGCEYIVMEQCSGEMLANRVDSPSQVSMFAAEIAEMQTRLASIKFSQYGSIYYKDNVSPELQACPLYAKGEPEDECSERFRIGPSVDRRFYRSERAHMEIDRGPCKMPFTPSQNRVLNLLNYLGVDVNSYIRACAACEIDWITKFRDSESARNQMSWTRAPSFTSQKLDIAFTCHFASGNVMSSFHNPS